eukprot:1464896-Prymnesium_polylepis.1
MAIGSHSCGFSQASLEAARPRLVGAAQAGRRLRPRRGRDALLVSDTIPLCAPITQRHIPSTISVCAFRITNVTTGVRTRDDCRGAGVQYIGLLPVALTAGVEYLFDYRATVPMELAPAPRLPHANIHSCLRHVGFCTPFVANTPELSTHSQAQSGTFVLRPDGG